MQVSIVTATYNHEQQVKKLYDSLVLEKAFVKDWLVCDDGSTDDTWRVLNNIRTQGVLDVKLYRQPNKGMRLAKNLNHGLLEATGDLIFIVMGDSYLQDNTLAELTTTYIPGSAGCGQRINVDSAGDFVSYDWRIPTGSTAIVATDDVRTLTGNSMILSRVQRDKVGLWDEAYEGYGKDDWDYFMRLKLAGIPLYQYNNVIINHIYHGDGQPDNPKSTAIFERKYHAQS